MNVVNRGDEYRPKDGEVLVLVVNGKQIVCRIELVHETREDEMFGALCFSCTLYPDLRCGEWLSFNNHHKVIPIEEYLE